MARRISGHKCQAFKKKDNDHFHNALRKYGINNFSWSILDYAEIRNQLNLAEKYWIKQYNTMILGYNHIEGGGSGKVSDITKRKIKEHHYNCSGINHPLFGKHLTEETKMKIREARKYQIFSIEDRQKMSLAQRARIRSEETGRKISNSKKGKSFSPEHCKNISISHRGINHFLYGKHHESSTKMKMSIAAKRRWNNPKDREIWITAIRNGSRWKQEVD